MGGRRALVAAGLCVVVALTLAACGGSKKSPPPPTAAANATDAISPVANATSIPPTAISDNNLASQIGVRADLPPNDGIDLAARYGRTQGKAAASKPFAGDAAVGSTRDFIVARLTGGALSHQSPPEIDTITATLRAKSAHAYFYVDNVLDADPANVQTSADDFETDVWPKVTSVFGEPAIPGVDGDPRIIVLQADLGGAVGGYYTGDDAYLRSVRPLSNEAEMVYLDRTLKQGGAAFDVVLAHEFQHLIHAHNDFTEEAWVNEGLSEDSSMLVGGAVSSIRSFEAKPETQLNFWDSEGSTPHYGAGAAFFRYLASRFGGNNDLDSNRMFGVIARAQRDGPAGVDEFLASRGETVHFRGVFADWIAANILNLDSGPYGNPDRHVTPAISNELGAGDPVDGSAHQFGTDYYNVAGLNSGDYVLRFRGRAQTPILPPSALDQGTVIWGNAEDSIDTRLTYDVDLTGQMNPQLYFETWFDIERWYDWGYVAASTDGGATWTALPGAQTTTDDPVKVAYGPGYTGKSGGGADPVWLGESIPLSAYAGKRMKLRFEYVADGGTHGEGWAIRNLGLSNGGVRENPPSGPTSEGWLGTDRPLAQTYIVRLIETKSDGTTAVLDVPLDASQSGELRFSSDGLTDAVVAIAGSTEGTNQQAPYAVQLAPP